MLSVTLYENSKEGADKEIEVTCPFCHTKIIKKLKKHTSSAFAFCSRCGFIFPDVNALVDPLFIHDGLNVRVQYHTVGNFDFYETD